MSRGVRLSLTVLVVILAALLPACGGGNGGPGGSGKPKIAIVTNCTATFWSICEAGAKDAGKEFDVEVIFKQPGGNTALEQMNIVNDVMKLKPSGLAVSVIDPKEQTPDLKLLAAKTNLLTMDNDADGCGRLAYIGCDNFEAGKACGRFVRQKLPNGGTVALFVGNRTSANAKARIAGVLSELAERDVRAAVEKDEYEATYGKYKLHTKPETDDTKEDKAEANALGALGLLAKDAPNVCLVGLYQYNPKKILAAVKSKRLLGKVSIVGFDEDPDTLDGIDKGEIVGSISQDPYNYGYETVKWLAHLARGGDKAALPTKPTAYRLVTQAGGPDQDINGTKVPNYKASEYATKLSKALSGK